MNVLEVSLQAAYDSVREAAPYVFWIISMTVLLITSFLIGVKHTDNIWKNNIKYHMKKVQKDEIDWRDNKLKEQENELIELRDKYNILESKMSGIQSLSKFEPVNNVPEKKILAPPPKPKFPKGKK